MNLYQYGGASIFKASQCQATTAAAKAAIPDPATSDDSWWEYILASSGGTHLRLVYKYRTGRLRLITRCKAKLRVPSTISCIPQYVLVNTLQLCDTNNIWSPLQLTNLNIPNNTSGDTLVVDAAMSTSAAPMYFPPYLHPVYGYCADGGLFANNPGMTAITSLMASGVPLANIWMLSISTGNTLDCYPAAIINKVGAADFGPLFWVFPASQTSGTAPNQTYTPSLPLMSAMFDATAEMDTKQCSQILGDQYVRANVTLTQPIALNDFSQTAITAMQDAVTGYTTPPSTGWAQIQSWITNNFGPNG